MHDTSCTAPEVKPESKSPDVRLAVPPILTVLEAAAVSTLSRRTICDAIANGRLQVKRVGRRVIITKIALGKFLGVTL